MSTILLFISLLMHVVTFFLMTRLRLNQRTNNEIEIEQLKSEIETLLTSHTVEMKKENERLLKHVQTKSRTKDNKEDISSSIETLAQPNEKETPLPIRKHANQKLYDKYRLAVMDSVDETSTFEQSITAQVLIYEKQGLSAGAIAKKLNIGTGEVELMLNLYR